MVLVPMAMMTVCDDDDDDGIVYCHFQNVTGPSSTTARLFAVHFSLCGFVGAEDA